jgi:hypothetical protein
MKNQQRKFQSLEELDSDEVYRRIKDYALETIIMTQRLQNLAFLTSDLLSSLDHISTRPGSTHPNLMVFKS